MMLDIGCYDGFFSFEAERRGAKRVLATDRHPIDHCGFAVAQELLGSKVEYAVASVFDLDAAVHGTFDVVLFLGVFYHLRHPLLSLEKIRRVCSGYMFLETQVLDSQFVHNGRITTLAPMKPDRANAMILSSIPIRAEQRSVELVLAYDKVSRSDGQHFRVCGPRDAPLRRPCVGCRRLRPVRNSPLVRSLAN
jgi:SAM-dependent methyltransferase